MPKQGKDPKDQEPKEKEDPIDKALSSIFGEKKDDEKKEKR